MMDEEGRIPVALNFIIDEYYLASSLGLNEVPRYCTILLCRSSESIVRVAKASAT